jgi:hypothetical protein
MVFPQPGPPHTIVGRPVGTPPFVTSSNPAIPVGDFSNRVILRGALPFRLLLIVYAGQYHSLKV